MSDYTQMWSDPGLDLKGHDALLINQVFFYDDPVRFTESVNKLCDELEDRVKKGTGVFPKGTTRVVVSGCPMAVPDWKLPWIVESSNAAIAGERGARWVTETKKKSVDELLDLITDRYFQIDCAIFTENPSRVEYGRRRCGIEQQGKKRGNE